MSYARNKRRKAIYNRNTARQKQKQEKGASTIATGKTPDAQVKRTPRIWTPKR